MARAKLIVATVVTVLIIILVLQNTEAVETKVLFATLTMPRALLLLVTMLAGYILGLLTLSHLLGKRRKKDDTATDKGVA